MYQKVESTDFFVEILVNNAGFGDHGFFHESDLKKQLSMIDVNIKSLTHLTHLFLPGMIEQDCKKIAGKINSVFQCQSFGN